MLPITQLPVFLSDYQWSLLSPLFPTTSRLKGTPDSLRGRPFFDPRLILELVFHKLTSRLPWYDLPFTSPSWQAVYQHYHRWQRTGTWKSIIYTLLGDLHARGDFDLLAAIENHEIQIQPDGLGRLDITFPPHLEGTWQASTTLLLVHLLFSGL